MYMAVSFAVSQKENAGRQAGVPAGDRADLVQNLVQHLRVLGGDLQQKVEPAAGGVAAFHLGNRLEPGQYGSLRPGFDR
jgi:hypothetical protein